MHAHTRVINALHVHMLCYETVFLSVVLCCSNREAEATLEEHEKMLLQFEALQEEAKVRFKQTQQTNIHTNKHIH
jgi:hypothetical protein